MNPNPRLYTIWYLVVPSYDLYDEPRSLSDSQTILASIFSYLLTFAFCIHKSLKPQTLLYHSLHITWTIVGLSALSMVSMRWLQVTSDPSHLREETKAGQRTDDAVGLWWACTIAFRLVEREGERERERERNMGDWINADKLE